MESNLIAVNFLPSYHQISDLQSLKMDWWIWTPYFLHLWILSKARSSRFGLPSTHAERTMVFALGLATGSRWYDDHVGVPRQTFISSWHVTAAAVLMMTIP
jgi:hypothetical protein